MKVPTRLLALSSPLSSKLFSIGGLGSHLIEGPSDYHLNLGKAVDTLRHDYPRLFVASPHMEIYHPKIELLRVDPGSDKKRVVIKGRERYEKMFSSIRFLGKYLLSESQNSEITHRLVYTDGTIRVRWNAKLWMRDPALGITKSVITNGEPMLIHVDGVSVYDLDDHGIVRTHRLEHFELSGREQQTADDLLYEKLVANLPAKGWPAGLIPRMPVPAPELAPLVADPTWRC